MQVWALKSLAFLVSLGCIFNERRIAKTLKSYILLSGLRLVVTLQKGHYKAVFSSHCWWNYFIKFKNKGKKKGRPKPCSVEHFVDIFWGFFCFCFFEIFMKAPMHFHWTLFVLRLINGHLFDQNGTYMFALLLLLFCLFPTC